MTNDLRSLLYSVFCHQGTGAAQEHEKTMNLPMRCDVMWLGVSVPGLLCGITRTSNISTYIVGMNYRDPTTP